jgi:transposase
VACYWPGDRPHLYYYLLVHRRRKGRAERASRKEWLRIYRLPAYAPDLNPAERASDRCSSGPWPTSPPRTRPGLVRIIKRKLKKIQYRPHLD